MITVKKPYKCWCGKEFISGGGQELGGGVRFAQYLACNDCEVIIIPGGSDSIAKAYKEWTYWTWPVKILG